MHAKKTVNPQIARWYDLIMEYDFTIKHRSGEQMAHADALSRNPVEECGDTMAEAIEDRLEVMSVLTLEEEIGMFQQQDEDDNFTRFLRLYAVTDTKAKTVIKCLNRFVQDFDNFTRFLRLYAVTDTKAKTVIKCLNRFVQDFGLPERIISDRGTAFTSKELEEFCGKNGVVHVLNSSRHPQANGMVERVHRTIIPMVSMKMKSPDDRNWDQYVDEVVAEFNATRELLNVFYELYY
ncbi:Integrase core domain [Popillia japonica]|uniref:Integrase core domain n=1 Tax=Popillia japonica TaxID=7064 RepID=A0AAW1N0C5_POPJA